MLCIDGFTSLEGGSTDDVTAAVTHLSECVITKQKVSKSTTYHRSSVYRTLAKVRPWALHLTFSPNRGVGALSSVSTFNLERAPTFALFTYTSSAISAIEQQARVSQSLPSTSTSLESLATSLLTTSSSLPPSTG